MADAAVLAGLLPGLHASRWNLAETLKSGARLTRSTRLRGAFTIAQVAIALTLLAAAALVGRSFLNVLRLDLGFDAANVVTVDIAVPGAEPERHNALVAELLRRVRAMPGVAAAAGVFQRPLQFEGIGTDGMITIEGQSTDPADKAWEQNPRTNHQTVTTDYFRTMRMRVVRGRAFAETDTQRSAPVVMLSEGLARRLWPGGDALGKRVLVPGTQNDAQGRPIWFTVVAVAVQRGDAGNPRRNRGRAGRARALRDHQSVGGRAPAGDRGSCRARLYAPRARRAGLL